MVENIGSNGTLLDWEIVREPNWGYGHSWTFKPKSGENLKPDDGPVTVQVTCVVPDRKNKNYSGRIKIQNMEYPDDYCYIDVYLSISKNKPFNVYFDLLSLLFEHFPMLEKLVNLLKQ